MMAQQINLVQVKFKLAVHLQMLFLVILDIINQ